MQMAAVFLLILCGLFGLYRVDAVVEITQNPSSKNITINSEVTVVCKGTGNLLWWLINGNLSTNSDLPLKGFATDSNKLYNDTISGKLTVIAYKENNITNITCTVGLVVNDSKLVTQVSPPAILMIQDILDGVGDLMATVIDGSNVSLRWTPPYSLDNVPITGYNIITSDGINITVNTTNHTLTSSDPDPCNITTVSVGAINDVGTSQYNDVSFYYQTAPPQRDGIVSITNGSRDTITVVVDLSSLCVGKRPNSITIDIIYSNEVVYTSDPLTIDNDELTIRHPIALQHDWIEYFIVDVTLSNRGGETSYPFPLGHLGPVNNISLSRDCSIINISWNRPSVHDGVNIHNYSLLIYDDSRLVSNVTVDGNTTSYEFVDKFLSHEYTYVINGNNELGEGDYKNGRFSGVINFIESASVFDESHFSIQLCHNVHPRVVEVAIKCDNTTVLPKTIYGVVNSSIIDNIIITPSDHGSCLLSVWFNRQGKFTKLICFETSNKPTSYLTDYVLPIVLGCSGVITLLIIGIVFAVCVCCYRKKKCNSRSSLPVNHDDVQPSCTTKNVAKFEKSNENKSTIVTGRGPTDVELEELPQGQPPVTPHNRSFITMIKQFVF